VKEADEGAAVRLDKWLWAARFFKTRSLAALALDGGRIRVNGERVKRARQVHLGDQVEVRLPPYTHLVVVRGLSERRGPASEARLLYDETAESMEARERIRIQVRAAGGLAGGPEGGRPTKRDRRKLERLRSDGGRG
jgi:ribosome-associated heat shock protein Hsp15